MLDRSRFYVPYPQLETAEEIVEDLFSVQPVDGEALQDEENDETQEEE
jgi:hypothetical protein